MRSAYRKIVTLVGGSPRSRGRGGSGGVAEAIAAAVARRSRASRRASTRSPSRSTGARAAIHRLPLPATAQKQLGDVLAFELEAQVPFDLESAVFD